MNARILCFISFALLASCKSNPNKAEVLETEIDKSSPISKDERIGVDSNNEMVYQRKVVLSEEIRKLQNSVLETEDRVYGTRAYGTSGLLGHYRRCYQKLPTEHREKFSIPETQNRLSEREEDLRVGIDPKAGKLAAISEEKLMDRITRLTEYRKSLQIKEDEMSEGLERCRLIVKD